jgi:hypothetical protein
MVEVPIDFYAEIIASITLGVVWLGMLRAYFKDRERDKRTLALSTGYGFFCFAIIAGFAGILLVLMGYAPGSMPLFIERFVYVFSAFATVPFTYFVVKLFFARGRWATYLMLVYAIVLTGVYLVIPSTVISMAPEAPTVWNTDLLPGIALLSITWVVFIMLAVKCFQTARKAKEGPLKTRFRLIGLAGVLGILIFFINAVTVLAPPTLVPYVSASSWSTAALAGIVSYIGWLRYK